MKKTWESPTIENLNLVETAYETRNGVVPDGYKDNDEETCWELYES